MMKKMLLMHFRMEEKFLLMLEMIPERLLRVVRQVKVLHGLCMPMEN